MSNPERRKEMSAKCVAYHRQRKREDANYAAKSKARTRRYYNKAKQDPERTEKMREQSRRQYHERKKDPQRYEAYLAKQRKYRRLRKQNDPNFAIKSHLRSRLSDMVRVSRCSKDCSALALTGATIEELRLHIERMFKRGMSWRNYGAVWHIDHIIPCSKFDLTDPRQRAICFNYLNLRPCWATENMRKSNRILEDSQLPLGI